MNEQLAKFIGDRVVTRPLFLLFGRADYLLYSLTLSTEIALRGFVGCKGAIVVSISSSSGYNMLGG